MEILHPSHWAPTKGYSAGVKATGTHIFIAGQVGWDANQQWQTSDFIEQFEQALCNVLDVLKSGQGEVHQITEMTIYVTDLDAYRMRARELGPIWRKWMGRHYPAMALVGVAGLVEKEAQVEIQARAVLND